MWQKKWTTSCTIPRPCPSHVFFSASCSYYIQVVEYCRGDLKWEQGLVEDVLHQNGLTHTNASWGQHVAISNDARQRYFATALLMSSDCGQYGKPLKDIENLCTWDQDNYPKTVTVANNLLVNRKHNPCNYVCSLCGLSNGVIFANVVDDLDDKEEDKQHRMLCAMKDVTCCACHQKGALCLGSKLPWEVKKAIQRTVPDGQAGLEDITGLGSKILDPTQQPVNCQHVFQTTYYEKHSEGRLQDGNPLYNWCDNDWPHCQPTWVRGCVVSPPWDCKYLIFSKGIRIGLLYVWQLRQELVCENQMKHHGFSNNSQVDYFTYFDVSKRGMHLSIR